MLTNHQISEHVCTMVAAIIKENNPKPSDVQIIEAVAALVTNLLQNINNIAERS